MKKFSFLKVALLMLVLCTSSVTYAQDLGSLLSGVANAVKGTSKLKASELVGTWKYTAPACQFESDNLLASAGGAVASKKVETQMQTLCNKSGLSNKSCKFVFSEDGKYTCSVGKNVSYGTYVFDESTQKLNLTTLTGIKFNGKVAMNGNAMRIFFQANKLLSLVKTISSTAAAGNVNSTVNLLSSLATQYKGMELGFELRK